MYTIFQLAYKYGCYVLKASNGKGHGTHSPFVYSFIKYVLNDDKNYYAYNIIEQQRKTLLSSKTIINIEDFGAGSTKNNALQHSVKSIAALALKPKKYAQLLFRIINYYQPKTIVELGTSLGITTSYLAMANNNSTVYTFEGSKEVAKIAQQNFCLLQINNIKIIEGNIDNTLPALLKTIATIDFAFIDGNHRYQPTVAYFEEILLKCNNESIVVLDDIHWSKEMEQAWTAVQQHPTVSATIDLFYIGIVVLKKEFKTKQHFVVRF